MIDTTPVRMSTEFCQQGHLLIRPHTFLIDYLHHPNTIRRHRLNRHCLLILHQRFVGYDY